MQKIATRVFIYSSIMFGVLGILMIITSTDPDSTNSAFDIVITKLIAVTVFIILPSFALSLAGKYLKR